MVVLGVGLRFAFVLTIMARLGSEEELDPDSDEDEEDSASSLERLGESDCFFSEMRFRRCFPSSAFFRAVPIDANGNIGIVELLIRA